jgi:hypothetical protein
MSAKTRERIAKLNESFDKVTSKLRGKTVTRRDVILKTYAVANGYKMNDVSKFVADGTGKRKSPLSMARRDMANKLMIASKIQRSDRYTQAKLGRYVVA